MANLGVFQPFIDDVQHDFLTKKRWNLQIHKGYHPKIPLVNYKGYNPKIFHWSMESIAMFWLRYLKFPMRFPGLSDLVIVVGGVSRSIPITSPLLVLHFKHYFIVGPIYHYKYFFSYLSLWLLEYKYHNHHHDYIETYCINISMSNLHEFIPVTSNGGTIFVGVP